MLDFALNLPLAFLNTPEGFDRPMAIAVDSRTRGFTAEALLERIKRLRAAAAAESK